MTRAEAFKSLADAKEFNNSLIFFTIKHWINHKN